MPKLLLSILLVHMLPTLANGIFFPLETSLHYGGFVHCLTMEAQDNGWPAAHLNPVEGATVELWERDSIKDDLVASNVTNNLGFYNVSGVEAEYWGHSGVYLVVSHNCTPIAFPPKTSGSSKCSFKSTFPVPLGAEWKPVDGEFAILILGTNAEGAECVSE